MKQQYIEAGKEYVHLADSKLRIKLLRVYGEGSLKSWDIRVISQRENSNFPEKTFLLESTLIAFFEPV